MDWLTKFVRESNRIEGINEVRSEEINVHESFLTLPTLRISDVSNVVTVCANAKLRNMRWMDVRVGDHVPIPGGPEVTKQLLELLTIVNDWPSRSAYLAHHDYETLHPYTDGNGRSGRLLWLWILERQALMLGKRANKPWRELGFLHWWYYQSLSEGRVR